MKPRAFLRFACLPFLAAGAAAGEEPLTWEACVAEALRSNPSLAAAARSAEGARASYRGSVNGVLPSLALSNSYSESHGDGADDDGRWRAQASAEMDVFDMGRVAAIRSAKAGAAQASAGLAQASVELRFTLRRAFAQLLFAGENVKTSQVILDMRRRSGQLVALRYNAGRESKGNMLRSKAQTLQAEADLAQARRDLRAAGTALGQELGREAFVPAAAAGVLDPAPAPDLPQDLSAVLARRPDVAAREAAARGAATELSRARSAFWPSLSLNYARTRTGESEFPSDRSGWSAGGVLRYPLFGGGPAGAFYATAAAGRGLERSQAELRAARAAAAVDIESAWSGFAGAQDQVKVRDALLEAARQRNAEADVRYSSGLLTYDNWEIIASDRIGSERQALQARLSAVLAQAAWERSTGALLGDKP